MRDPRESIPDPLGQTHEAEWVGKRLFCACGNRFGPALGMSARTRHSRHITHRMMLPPPKFEDR